MENKFHRVGFCLFHYFNTTKVSNVECLVESSCQLLIGEVEGEAHGVPHITVFFGIDNIFITWHIFLHQHKLCPSVLSICTFAVVG